MSSVFECAEAGVSRERKKTQTIPIDPETIEVPVF
jgi:hypothetical protein